MAMEFYNNNQVVTENVIFIGLYVKKDYGKQLSLKLDSVKQMKFRLLIFMIFRIHLKTIKTQDININNYQQFLNPTES